MKSAISVPRRLFIALLLFAAFAASARDIREFGAKGDGTADDTAAIQRAVSAGGAVHFSKGTYRLTKTVLVELDKTGFVSLIGDGTARVLMAGAGPAFKFLGTHGGTADPEQFKPNVWERQRMPVVDSLAIEGAHAEANGIEAEGTMQITITRSHFRSLRHHHSLKRLFHLKEAAATHNPS